jgi:hypothetical protein
MTLAMDHTHRYKKEYDPSTGDFYYFNEKTGETQWRKPGEGSALLLKVKEPPGQDDDVCPTRSVSPEVNEEGGGQMLAAQGKGIPRSRRRRVCPIKGAFSFAPRKE